MKLHCVISSLAILVSAHSGSVSAAVALPAEALDRIQVSSPTIPSCSPASSLQTKGCTEPEQLQELTDESIQKTLETTSPLPTSGPSMQQLPQVPDVTPQQQQIMDDFIQRPWGR
jgi:hypothetical protein